MSRKFKKVLAGILALCTLAGSMSAALAAEGDTIRIEGEWYQGENMELVDLSQSKLDVKVVDAAGVNFDNYLFDYGVCVKNSGFYTITLASNSVTVPAAKLYVNGAEVALSVNGGNATATAKLEAGENVLGVKVYKGVSNGVKDVVSFILDYIDIAPYDETIIVKKEAESFDSTTVNTNVKYMSQISWEALSNISGNNGIATDGQKAACAYVYTVNAPADGEYKFVARAQAFSINSYSVEVNGKSYAVNSGSAQQTVTNAKQGGVTLYDTALTEKVVLNSGANTVKIIPSRRSDANDYFIKMDYMTFEYVGAAAGVAAETVYQIQDVSVLNANSEGMKVTASSNASGGSFVTFEGGKSLPDTVSFTSTLNVAESGTYELTFVYGGRTDANGSRYEINFNDEKDSSGEPIYTVIPDSCVSNVGFAGAVGGLYVSEYSKTVNINAGTYKINILTHKRTGGQNDYFAGYDCYRLKKVSDLDKVVMTIPNNFLAENSTTPATVVALDESGAGVTDEAVITYSSDNENIATVDDDGVITAHNPGNAKITASVAYEGITQVTKTASVDVTVYGKDGVVLLGAERSGKDVSVRISSVGTAKTGALNLYAALYGTENGKLTSLKEVKLIANDGYVPTFVQVARASFNSEIGANDVIRVFCWAGDDYVTPCFAALDVE